MLHDDLKHYRAPPDMGRALDYLCGLFAGVGLAAAVLLVMSLN